MAGDINSNTKHQIRIFLASPADVIQYRKATKSIIDALNEPAQSRDGHMPYYLYTWETSKQPNHTDDYQKDIFTEFGKHCDIFILLLWHKIGQGGTIKEYEKFESVFKKQNPKIKLWVAHIDQKIEPSSIIPEQLLSLRQFINKHENNWAPLAQERQSIMNVKSYKELLMQELAYYKDHL